MSLLIVPLSYPDLAGLLNFSQPFQHNFRVADQPEVGQTSQYMRLTLPIGFRCEAKFIE